MSTRLCDVCQTQQGSTHYVPARRRFECDGCENQMKKSMMMDTDKEGVLNNLEYAYENMKQASNTLRAHGYENEAGDVMELASNVLYRMSLIRDNL
jgi:hypothetical protein